ncbi:HoxN/HupN/NixA family nickel/cobalt transporter [Pseudoclavibacter chungangensis]|uniref:Nickel/cobalt efflux system n=2 Tax=Pseudoclavibacter chungangensis TaxID=587635 RepID=A0A7J5BRI9_9MICO|nr:HoxN/HupN/NixA family nickel/cobalt transporter [Pseudoclavibacter chungangensis]
MGGVIAALFASGFALLAAATSSGAVPATAAFGFGTGLLAMTLGMRHAFDADHIAAIDNTTRKLVGEGRSPLAVGFFFALGHSTIVLLLVILLAFGIRALGSQVQDEGSPLQLVTGVIGTTVSATFLFLIAAVNIAVTVSLVRSLRRARAGEVDEEAIEAELAKRGFLTRLFRRVGDRIDASWKMYPLGMLFGLGFDTATEVGLLVLAGASIASGLPWWAMLSLPLLFAAGMCLFDTLDGAFMNVAYRWAVAQPVRRLTYNVVVTTLSVVIALVIGALQVLSLVGERFELHGAFWDAVGAIDLTAVGFGVVGLLAVTWIVAVLVWRFARPQVSALGAGGVTR